MPSMKEAVDDFLALKRIAVAGVSRSEGQAANFIYKKLRDSGYEVFPVNPAAEEVEGDVCYPDLKSLPGPVDGVVIATHPKATDDVVRQCAEVGVTRAWMHRSFGQGSVSESAVEFCRDNGITAIAGGCPMMFCPPVDIGHKCMRWMLKVTGGLPKEA
jgi:predicted CoA-binding protein